MNSSDEVNVTILGWYGNANSGDEANLAMLVGCLKQSVPRVNISVFSADPGQTSELYGVTGIHRGLMRALRQTINTIRKSHLFVIGGGTLLQDQGPKNSAVSAVCGYIMLGVIFRVPIAFYAQGVGPLKRKVNRILTRSFANRVSLITVRDKDSRDILANLGVCKPKIIITGDPVINLEETKSERIEEIFVSEGLKNRRFVAICPSGRLAISNGQKKTIESEVAKVADLIVEELDVDMLFIPMQFKGAYNDLMTAETIIRQMKTPGRAKLLKHDYNPKEVKGILSKMELVIGFRLHALIFATGSNVPVIGISHSDKISGFLKMLNQERFTIEMDELGCESIFAKVKEIWKSREEIQTEIRENVDRYKKEAAKTISYVENLLYDLYGDQVLSNNVEVSKRTEIEV
jgi:polysaccharide pyruvyl transferase CsaB